MARREKNEKIKEEYLDYYKDVPVQKYAAMYVGKSEDTIIRWRKQDPSFAHRVEKLKAEWIRKKAASLKAEFALERLEAEVFSRKEPNYGISFKQNNLHVYLPEELPHSVVEESLSKNIEKPFDERDV